MKLNRFMGAMIATVITASSFLAAPCYAENLQDAVSKPNMDAPNTNVTDETLVVSFASEPSGLWGSATGKVENEMLIINMALTDSLICVDPLTYEIKPNLATEWEWKDDTHCRFVLRDDVMMSDGTPLVADDVVYSVNVWKENSPNTDTGRFFEDAVAEDEHTVLIGFNTSAPDMLKMLSWSNFGIVSEDEINALGGIEEADKTPIFGSGKYRFVSWDRGQSIVLERNDSYWNPDYKGYFKTIKFTFTTDPSARILTVQSGDAQVACQLPLSMGSALIGNETVKVYAYELGENLRLWYNMGPKAGATADLKVRQAIDKALDFNAIAAVGTAGMAAPTGSYFPGTSKYSESVFTDEERAVDIDGAKELLKEAGYEDGLSLKAVGLADQELEFTVIQECLRQIGIDLTLSIVDVPTYLDVANAGDYDLIYLGDQIDLRYPSCLSFFMQSSIDTFCIGGAKWTTPEIEAAIHEFIEERDEDKAVEEARALQEMLKAEMPYSNTCPHLQCTITDASIKGVTTGQMGALNPTTLYK